MMSMWPVNAMRPSLSVSVIVLLPVTVMPGVGLGAAAGSDTVAVVGSFSVKMMGFGDVLAVTRICVGPARSIVISIGVVTSVGGISVRVAFTRTLPRHL